MRSTECACVVSYWNERLRGAVYHVARALRTRPRMLKVVISSPILNPSNEALDAKDT